MKARQTGIRTTQRLLALLGFLTLSGWLAATNLSVGRNARPYQQQGELLYRRDASIASPGSEQVEIILLGDIMPARVPLLAADSFREVSRELSSADLAIGNLEGVVVSQDLRRHCQSLSNLPAEYRILIPLQAAKGLQRSGFDLLGLANNHVLDCGELGLSEMMGVLHNLGMKTAGTVSGHSSMAVPTIITKHGLRIAVLPFTTIRQDTGFSHKTNLSSSIHPAVWDPVLAVRTVQQAQAEADFVIVSMHWGEEYDGRANLRQRATAQTLVDAGADLVIGHHPHVVQETQVVQRAGGQEGIGFVAYSLGNFMFDQYEASTRIGLALRVLVDKHGLKAVEGWPVSSSPQPHWMNEADSRELLQHIKPILRRTGFECNVKSCNLVEVDPPKPEGIFLSGSIDLTGDGQDEAVWLRDGRIYVYKENELVWKSPENWRVIDLTLGDPNDDGRYEIMAAVNGDRTGEITSQPFILGYRGGIYRQLWGGSPVSDPILEVELGDVDSDGSQELVVIEKRGAGKQTVAVWDWHGWGFSLLWRSLKGRFSDLVVQDGAGDQEIINVGQPW